MGIKIKSGLSARIALCRSLGHCWLGLLLFVAMAFVPCLGQSTSGAFLGRVTDQHVRVVVGASVVLRNETTGIEINQTTDQAGEYAFNSVSPGLYRISISAPGFSTKVVSNINLDVQQTIREDLALSVGSTSATISVTAAAPLIQTESSDVSNVVTGEAIEQAPLDGRENAYSLMGLASGVQRPNSNALISGGSFKGGANLTIDGISDDDVIGARMSDQVPSLEAMAEFNVTDVNAAAEYGNGSAQVNIQTKSGTNQFHGSAFEFNRNVALEANPYFNYGHPKPGFNRNEWGGSVGGPVIRTKLFFFFSYEGIHSLTTTTRSFTMPTLAMLTGDFSAYPTLAGQSTIVYDPTTGLPFPNNKIPFNRISSISSNFLPFYSTPNTTTSTGLGTNYVYQSPTLEIDPRYTIRADYQINQADHVMFRFYNSLRTPAPYDEGGTPKYGNYKQLGNIINQFASSYTHVFRNNIVNELTFGVNKRADPRVDQNNEVDQQTLVPGLPPTDPGYGLLPTVSITGIATVDSPGSSFQHQHAIQTYEALSILRGRHNIKVGGQFLSDGGAGTNYNSGTFNFNGQYTGQFGISGQTSNPINSFADFLLGDMTGSSNYSNKYPYSLGMNSYAIYATDDWDLTPRLTLNVGLRYEKLLVPTISQASDFIPSIGTGALVAFAVTPLPSIMTAFPQIVLGSSVGVNPSNWLHMGALNFAPRVGFSYRPLDGKDFVVRGGYGIFYDNITLSDYVQNLGNQVPFILSTSYTAQGGDVPSLTFANPFPTTGGVTGNPNVIGAIRNLPTPYQEQFNLTLEDQTWKKIALRATYLGNLGTHLHTPLGLNNPIPQSVGPGYTYASTQAARPYQPYAGITYYTNGESTNTNQFQFSARRRFSQLSFDLEYQYTKALGIDGPNEEAVTDTQNIRHDYGNLDFYSRHELSLVYNYNLPVGRGQMLLGNANPVVDEIFGGWQLSGTWQAYSGTPFSVSFNSSNGGFPSGRADYHVGIPVYADPKGHTGWLASLSGGAFTVPAYTYGNFGDSQRNMLYGPSFSIWNGGVHKDFRIIERVKFQFRAEGFDLLNRTNFSNPNANVSVPTTWGTITSTATNNTGSTGNRELQFGGRLSF
jgi:hypothetical protein